MANVGCRQIPHCGGCTPHLRATSTSSPGVVFQALALARARAGTWCVTGGFRGDRPT